MTAETPARAAYECWHAFQRRRFPGIMPIAWDELGPDAQADWEAIAGAASFAVTAERDTLRALIARLLGMFGRGSDGMRARMSLVTFIRCKRDAGMEISEEERRMTGD
jgi:hypothetical protein